MGIGVGQRVEGRKGEWIKRGRSKVEIIIIGAKEVMIVVQQWRLSVHVKAARQMILKLMLLLGRLLGRERRRQLIRNAEVAAAAAATAVVFGGGRNLVFVFALVGCDDGFFVVGSSLHVFSYGATGGCAFVVAPALLIN